jgi:threonine dehydrogenase-like Zn-dependent dehydrogenase
VRALVYTAPSVVEVLDVAEPQAAEGEVVLDVAAVGICGSELHGIQTPGFRTPPLVMGHELAGVTPEGERVTVNPMVSCRGCDMCSRGLRHLCRTRAILGIHRAGAFAERVAVPRDRLVVIPEQMPWESAAMVEPLANAVHAWHLANPYASEVAPARVGIIGAGTIGLVCLLVAKHAGASQVSVADLADTRLGLARDLGADCTSAALEGEFDVIVDAVGSASTHEASVRQLRPGGTAVWLGLLDDASSFGAQALIRGEKRVLGSFCYSDDEFRLAVDLAMQVELGWADSFPLDDGATVFTELMNGRTDVAKALLRP